MVSPHRNGYGAFGRLMSYGLVTIVAAGATFLTVPVLIRLLGIDGFGLWSLIEPLILVGGVLVLLGSEHGAIKQIAYDRLAPGLAAGRLLMTAAPAAILIALAFFVGFRTFWDATLAVPAVLLMLAEGLLTLLTASCRAADRPAGYALGQGGRAALFLAILAPGFVWSPLAIDSVEGVAAARLAIAALLALGLAVILRARPGWAPRAYGDAVRYGGFILATGLLAMVVEAGDRYILAWFRDPMTVGIYVVHIKMAAIVGQGITTPFMLWFPVERFRHLQDADGGSAFFSAAAVLLLGMLLAVSGSVWLMGPLLMQLFAPGVGFDPVVSAYVLAATVAVGMGYPMNVGLLKPGLTHRNVYPSLLAALLSMALAVALVPSLGPTGAGVAKAVGAVAVLAMLTILSQRVHRVVFAYGRMMALAAMSVALLAVMDRVLQGSDMTARGVAAAVFLMAVMTGTVLTLEAATRKALLDLVPGFRARVPQGADGTIR